MRIGLRTRLMVAASALALVPLAGYHALERMRELVRERQETATVSAARGVAWGLGHGLPESLSAAPPPPPPSPEPALYLLPFARAPVVDGQTRDWAGPAPGTLPALDAGLHGSRAYLLVRLPVPSQGAPGDLLLRLLDSDAFVNTWRLSLARRGPTDVVEIAPLGRLDTPGHVDRRFEAAVAVAEGIRVVELSLPRGLLAASLSIARLARAPLDPFDTQPALRPLLRLPPRGSFRLVLPDPALQQRIRGLAGPGRRIWVLGRGAHVLARDGAAAQPSPGSTQRLLNRLLPGGEMEDLVMPPEGGRLSAPEVGEALAGRPAVVWRTATAGGARVVSAAMPVHDAEDGEVVGAVVVEDVVNALEDAEFRGTLELLIATGGALLLAILVLLSVSARMVGRLRELRADAARAIDPQGRIGGGFRSQGQDDEIGDLRRSFGAALARIEGYNSYLEQLARRLSHELRTPVTIVRSSLENLELDVAGTPQALPDSAAVYLARARDGVKRLDDLISRMTEAARLEQAVSAEEREPVDLEALLEASVTASAETFGDAQLRLELDPLPDALSLAPALILQAMDKLLANARDFRRPDSVVRVVARAVSGYVEILVCNEGPVVESQPTEAIFDSMVSRRSGQGDASQCHLGLGLYVVRLIAVGHGGYPVARNHADGSGVCIGFAVPLPV